MKIIVTDLTRFSNREIVCLAGIDPSTGQCIRPMRLKHGKLDYLPFSSVKKHKVIPGSLLEANFTPVPNLHAPHTEDHSINETLTLTGAATSAEFEQVLANSSATTVISGFGMLPTNRLYGLIAPPVRSIMTLKLDSPHTQFSLTVDTAYGTPKFKAHIIDASGYRLSYLPVTDLGFSDHLLSVLKTDATLSSLNSFLQNQKSLYIRLGLSRRYAAPNDPLRDGYWVQVNGIYSFPSYRQDLRIYD